MSIYLVMTNMVYAIVVFRYYPFNRSKKSAVSKTVSGAVFRSSFLLKP